MLPHVILHLLFLLLIQLGTIVIFLLLLPILIETVELVIIIVILLVQIFVLLELSSVCLGNQLVLFFAVLLVEFLLFLSSELLP